jgi:hypothetical protein
MLTTAIEYDPTIRLLNIHGEIMASKSLDVTPRFRGLFQDFINAIAKADFPADHDYLARDMLSQCASAYWTFFLRHIKKKS